MSETGSDPNHNPSWKAQKLEPYTGLLKLLHNESGRGNRIFLQKEYKI
jgi:hypothetical protein